MKEDNSNKNFCLKISDNFNILRSEGETMSLITELIKIFSISDDQKQILKNRIGSQFEAGLAEDPNIYMFSPLKMLPTYISVFPDQEHQGCFISIDFGGTNIRFVKIIINNSNLLTEFVSEPIPEHIKTGSCQELFNYLAKCLENGLVALNMENVQIKYVGFTFSFPCAQNALNHGVLIHWTKGFNVAHVEGKDVCSLLLSSCKNIGLKIENFCLLNDTTGTLLCGSYEDRNTFIGLINGTGTNACYLERSDKVKKLKPNSIMEESVIINTEWGSLGENGCLDIILTKYDIILDSNSINPKHQIFEKCISGLYLPELVRIIIIEESPKLRIFSNFPTKLMKPYSLDGHYLSMVYDKNDFIKNFNEQFMYELSYCEYRFIKEISIAIVSRAATLTALSLAKLMDRISSKIVTVAVDGSMCLKHPTYMLMVAQELKNHTTKYFEFKYVDDGSGKGSALAACIASYK